jgi:hypothetical protein
MIPVVGPARRNKLRPMGAVRRGWDKTDSGKRQQGLSSTGNEIVRLVLAHFEEVSRSRRTMEEAASVGKAAMLSGRVARERGRGRSPTGR